MPVVGVTGHVVLPTDDVAWLRARLDVRLAEVVARGFEGVTCLARGADQMFAAAVIAADGKFRVVLPARDYATRMRAEGHGELFDELLQQAAQVDVLPQKSSGRDAYVAASEEMLDRCELLLAVWDGRPSRAPGDTADVIRRALGRRLPVEIVWPRTSPAHAAVMLGVPPVTSQRSVST